MNYTQVIDAIAAGTHRVLAYGIKGRRTSHSTRYILEKLTATHGWLEVSVHTNTLRRAVRDLPRRYDMVLSMVVYDNACVRAVRSDT